MIPVQYIGHRAEYREGCYGSGLVFVKDQIINVEDDALALKLLKHKDVYRRGKAPGETTAPVIDPKKPEDEEDKTQDLRDSISVMTKASVLAYAKTNFRTDLDASKKVGELRAEVIGLIDRFGTE